MKTTISFLLLGICCGGTANAVELFDKDVIKRSDGMLAQADIKPKNSQDNRPAPGVPPSFSPVTATPVKSAVSPEELKALKQEVLAKIAELDDKAEPIPTDNETKILFSMSRVSAATIGHGIANDKNTFKKFGIPNDLSQSNLAKEELHKYFVYLGIMALLSGDDKYFADSESPEAPVEYKVFDEFMWFVEMRNVFTHEEFKQITSEIYGIGNVVKQTRKIIEQQVNEICLSELNQKGKLKENFSKLNANLNYISSIMVYSKLPPSLASYIKGRIK